MKKDNKHSKVVKKSELNKNTFQVSRRSFITKTALAAGAVTIVPRHVLGKGFTAPSDKINLGFIGLGKQSRGLAKNFIKNDAEIIACSDVWTTKNNWLKIMLLKISWR